MNIQVNINGKNYSHDVEPRLLLIHYLREVVGLTGPHIGCETSLCGACTVEVDGRPSRAAPCSPCRPMAPRVLTIEGLAAGRQTARDAGSLLERTRPAVRFLYAGHDHGFEANPRPQPQPHRRGNPAGPRRQYLPLHRLSAHRQRRAEPRRKRGQHNGDHHGHRPSPRPKIWSASASAAAKIRA